MLKNLLLGFVHLIQKLLQVCVDRTQELLHKYSNWVQTQPEKRQPVLDHLPGMTGTGIVLVVLFIISMLHIH